MNQYIQLAKKAIESFILEHKTINSSDALPQEMLNEKAGVFVTIYNHGDLRGCIGTFLPTEDNIVQEIIQNAISAAARDYRFKQITKDELPELNYEVSILAEPEQIKSVDELDAKKYGVLVRTESGKSGLLLPDLEDVDTPEQQISICCQKGGIDPEEEKLILYRFQVTKYI